MLWKLVENVKYEDIYEVSMGRRGTLAGAKEIYRTGPESRAGVEISGRQTRVGSEASRGARLQESWRSCLPRAGEREAGRRGGGRQKGIFFSEASLTVALDPKRNFISSFFFCFRFLLPLKK